MFSNKPYVAIANKMLTLLIMVYVIETKSKITIFIQLAFRKYIGGYHWWFAHNFTWNANANFPFTFTLSFRALLNKQILRGNKYFRLAEWEICFEANMFFKWFRYITFWEEDPRLKNLKNLHFSCRWMFTACNNVKSLYLILIHLNHVLY